VEYAEVGTFNKMVAMAFGSDQDSESCNAFDIGKKFLKDRNASITDFKLVLANSEDGRASGMEHWERQFNRLFRELDAKESALQSARAETDTVRRERDELRAKLEARVAVKPAKAGAAHRELAELRAAREETRAELIEANCAKAEAEVQAHKACRERDELRATLDRVTAELRDANQAKAEAEARADAARRENDELRAALQEATAELREAQRVADVCRDAAANDGRVDAAGAATDNPTSSAEAHEHHAETVENPACTHPSDDVASDRQQGWNPRFDAKAVGLYWRAVHAINADLEAGLITKKQASGRKASALRDYKSRATLGSRARNARRAA
jgi:hypothetical protein